MDTFIFPGQGSQRPGMGAELFDTVEAYRQVESEADALLGYSTRELCLGANDPRLGKTEYTQPALYVVNALHYYAALAEGRQPQLVAGHSLGEYNALLAAGVFDFLTGLKLVQKRGQLMGQARQGGMAAVLGVPGAKVVQLLATHGFDTLDVANFNGPTQLVLSGPLVDIERAGAVFEANGASAYVPLQVSAAFHSRYMRQAATEYAGFLADFEFAAAQLPVISNVTARPHRAKNGSAQVKELLVAQIHSPVQWTHSVSYLLGRGAERFHEMGPGSVLTRLVDQIRYH
jgi:malonyl CoA-acyl carrier protein transacylase